MSINDFAVYLNSNVAGVKVYPVVFTPNSDDDSSIVQFTGGQPTKAGLISANLQVLTRASHPAKAEQDSMKIRDFLEGKTNFKVGTMNVVLCKAFNPMPMYLGKDMSDRHSYSINFSLKMEG